MGLQAMTAKSPAPPGAVKGLSAAALEGVRRWLATHTFTEKRIRRIQGQGGCRDPGPLLAPEDAFDLHGKRLLVAVETRDGRLKDRVRVNT